MIGCSCFWSTAVTAAPFIQVPFITSQVKPVGQQCTPSEQHTPFSWGQQPYCSEFLSLQQVLFSGHSLLSGHHTFCGFLMAGSFFSTGIIESPLVHIPPSWHLKPSGQQCTWSEQHTALGSGQQPYCPDLSLQQVESEEHSLVRSGHTTFWGDFMAGTFFSVMVWADFPASFEVSASWSLVADTSG